MHFILIALGMMLLVGLFTDEIGRRTRLPRVTLLILFGIAIGPYGLDLLPVDIDGWYAVFTDLALIMVAFLLGSALTVERLKAHGREILMISLAVCLTSALLVGIGMAFAGAATAVALILAGISVATEPAATMDVVHQERAKGPFTDTVIGVVAIDDVWSIVLFSVLLAVASAGVSGGVFAALSVGAWDLIGACLVGVAVGLPGAALSGRLGAGEPTRLEALGIIFLCGGFALWLEVSFLLAGIVAGAIVANVATHHTRPFHEIEHVEWPFLIIFFLLAGATFDIGALQDVGLIALVFIVLRVVGRLVGGWVGVKLSGAPRQHGRLIGMALTPQAGVSVGMALVAGNVMPQYADLILTVTIAATIVFEALGPFLTAFALRLSGEARAIPEDPEPSDEANA
ncbi:MAG: cation:proton antiporter [Pseudomonadota bacterium]